MSGQIASVLYGLRPLAPHPPSRPSSAAPGSTSEMSHRRTGPDSPWCSCGRAREVCVRESMRHLWSIIVE
jgi:hypothetical protein